MQIAADSPLLPFTNDQYLAFQLLARSNLGREVRSSFPDAPLQGLPKPFQRINSQTTIRYKHNWISAFQTG